MHSLAAVVRLVLCVALLALPASATWSILIVDLATGEVAVGIATCLVGFDLRPNTVVVVPGYGVAAAQSFVGPLSLRELIRAQLQNGTPPNQILAMLAAADPGHQTRQYGIVDVFGGSATFTGSGAGAFAGGLTGRSGTLGYAIQGNVLTGAPVLQAAEQAILTTPGSVADKLMAAMQAAASMGGDGRCSCNQSAPTSCGSPPPSFQKSSHIGLMIVSRPGDLDAPCNGAAGCAAGQYYLDLNVANQPATAPDAVQQLNALYTTWRAQQVGRPDHFRSVATVDVKRLRAGGLDVSRGTVYLHDALGNPLGTTLPVTVSLNPASTVRDLEIGPVVPQANGSYTFTVRGRLETGLAVLDVVANDGIGPVRISPAPAVQIESPFGACGIGAVGDGSGIAIDALRVDGSAGQDRIVRLGFAQPFVLTLDPPPAAPSTPPVGAFALWMHLGVPPGPTLPLGPGHGALCFQPWPLGPGASSVLLVDTFGLGGLLPGMPAPWSTPFPGVPALLDFALQAAMVVDLRGTVVATNAVLLHVQPLPPPRIDSVTPPFAAAGATVDVAGANFFSGLELRVGGTVVAPTAQTATSLRFSMPAGVPCDSTIAVTNPGGAPVTASINASPVIVATPFASGPASGGALYVVTGRNLTGATVTIGGAPLSITSQTATSIVGNTPPGTVGPAVVVVQNAIGCGAMTGYTYQ